jgi:hypothetical protein
LFEAIARLFDSGVNFIDARQHETLSTLTRTESLQHCRNVTAGALDSHLNTGALSTAGGGGPEIVHVAFGQSAGSNDPGQHQFIACSRH